MLDNTAVHPESYAAAKRLLQLFDYSERDVANEALAGLAVKIEEFGEEKVAEHCGVGLPTLRDIVAELQRPGRDIRDSLPQPELRVNVMDIADLKEGMTVTGTVRNVIDFGAFVDIGASDGLVHISKLAKRFKASVRGRAGGRHSRSACAVGGCREKRISLSMVDV